MAINRYKTSFAAALILLSCSCKTTHTRYTKKTLIATVSNDSLSYELYGLPVVKEKKETINLSMRIINKRDNTSPLRKRCADINEYNLYYEYLLNQAKNDISLTRNDQQYFPVYYSFENNYNAFPFETVNIGYQFSGRQKKGKYYELVYIDRVFAKDTVRFRFRN